MAPEQARSQPVAPAADWYAVGVVLYEALTGERAVRRLAARGADAQAGGAAARRRALLARRRAGRSRRAVPAACCAVDPARAPATAERSCGARARRRCRRDAHAVASQPLTVGAAVRRPRGASSARSTPRSRRTRDGRSVTVHRARRVGRGQERRWCAASPTSCAGAPTRWCSSGRCYERESVPYKALDGVIDALTQLPGAPRPSAEAAALLPRADGASGRRCSRCCRASRRWRARRAVERGARSAGAARARVRRAARALRRGWPIGGRSSSSSTICSGPTPTRWRCSPRSCARPTRRRSCCVATVRTRRRASISTRSRASSATTCARCPSAACRPTRRASWRALLAADAARRSAPSAGAIAHEAGGHPLFIDELVRHARRCADRARAAPRRRAVGAHAAAARGAARASCALTAIAGAPLWQETAARAADARGLRRASAKHVAALRARSTWCAPPGTQRRDTIEPYHDRVRAALSAHLDDDERRDAARSPGARARVVGAGRSRGGVGALARARATPTRRRATPRTPRRAPSQALAFDRAAELYRRSLAAARRPTAPRGDRCASSSADALATAGRGPRRRAAFLAAEARRQRRRGARAAAARRRAAPALGPHRRGARRDQDACSTGSGSSCRRRRRRGR